MNLTNLLQSREWAILMNWIKFVLHIYFDDVQVSGQLCILIITGGINSSEGLQLVIVGGSFPGEDYHRGNGDWKKTSNPWWTPTDVQEILLCIKYWQVWCMIQTIGFISSFERYLHINVMNTFCSVSYQTYYELWYMNMKWYVLLIKCLNMYEHVHFDCLTWKCIIWLIFK